MQKKIKRRLTLLLVKLECILNVCDKYESLFYFLETSISNLCEKRLLWLPHHGGFTVCSIFKSRHEGPGAEGQTILTFVVPSLVDGNERSSIQNHSGDKCTRSPGSTAFIKLIIRKQKEKNCIVSDSAILSIQNADH